MTNWPIGGAGSGHLNTLRLKAGGTLHEMEPPMRGRGYIRMILAAPVIVAIGWLLLVLAGVE